MLRDGGGKAPAGRAGTKECKGWQMGTRGVRKKQDEMCKGKARKGTQEELHTTTPEGLSRGPGKWGGKGR